MDEEYKTMGLECVQRAYDLLEAKDWKQEKVTPAGDIISSTERKSLGKVFKLTGTVYCQAAKLIYELFTQIEDVPQWNPTLLESKIIHKIDYFTDITYQASVGGGGGMVKSRDFVNLRCYRVVENGVVMTESEMKKKLEAPVRVRRSSLSTVHEQSESEASVKSESCAMPKVMKEQKEYLSSSMSGRIVLSSATEEDAISENKRVGEADEDDDDFVDCDLKGNRMYISSAQSIDYAGYPACTKYIRGQNLISSMSTREVASHPNECIFEWLLCLDLKGYIPSMVLDTAYKTLMQDYMGYLRKRFEKKF